MKKLLLLFSICMMGATAAHSQDDTYYTGDEFSVTIRANTGPPELPVYTQPLCPGDGYIWIPGYWAWGTGGYFWVAGVWVMPPGADLLWTPGYWGFYGGYYGWHGGYWGGSVGYYGGVNYGFGYYGSGFYGGRWEGGHFHYNTAVWRVGGGVHNTYVSHDGVHNGGGHASYNGPGGVKYHPAAHEQAGMHDNNHIAATKEHTTHEQNMGAEKGQFHSPSARPATHSMSVPGGQRYNQNGRTISPGGSNAPRGGSVPHGGNAPRGGGGAGAPHGGGGGGKH